MGKETATKRRSKRTGVARQTSFAIEAKPRAKREQDLVLSARDALSCCTRRRELKVATDLEASESSKKKRKGARKEEEQRERESGKTNSEARDPAATCSIFSGGGRACTFEEKKKLSIWSTSSLDCSPNPPSASDAMPTAPLPLSKRPGSIVAALFFASHIPVTLLVDSQAGEKKRVSFFFSF